MQRAACGSAAPTKQQPQAGVPAQSEEREPEDHARAQMPTLQAGLSASGTTQGAFTGNRQWEDSAAALSVEQNGMAACTTSAVNGCDGGHADFGHAAHEVPKPACLPRTASRQRNGLCSVPSDDVWAYLMEGFLEEGRKRYGDGEDALNLLCPKKAPTKWDLGPGFGADANAGENDVWANFVPGQSVYSPCGPGGTDGPGGVCWASAAAACTTTSDKVSIRLNKDLAAKWSARDILETSELHLAQFDVINAVTALHRVAKSTDRLEVQRDTRLSTTLTALIDKVVLTVTDSEVLIEAKEVTKTCWALSKLQLGTGPTMDAIAEQVVRKVDELDGQGLSNAVWGFATARIVHRRLLAAVAGEAVRQLEDFDPQGLSNSAWAFAKLAHHEAALMQRLAEEVTLRADSFDPQGLSNCGWAFATLGLRNQRLMDAIVEEMLAGVTRWSPQNIGNITWAFAKLKMMHRRMVDAVCKEVIQTIYDWNPQGLANVMWSFAKIQVRHQQFYDTVAKECTEKISSFKPQNLVNVAWSYAKLAMKNERELFKGISENVIRKARDFSPQHCSNAVWAFGTLVLVDVPVLDSVAQRVVASGKDFHAQDLSNVAWAFAKLLRRDHDLMAVVSREVVRKARLFQPQNLSITAYAFGQLHIPNQEMLDAIMAESERKISEFDGQGLSNLCQAMAKTSLPNNRALRLVSAEAEGKIADFTNQELAMVAWSYAKLGVLAGAPLLMLTNETRARLDRLTPQDLSVLIWAYARSGTKSREVMEILSWEVLKRSKALIPQDLANITWAYATVAVKNEEMMQAIAKEAIPKVRNFTVQDLANCSWGFARLDVLHMELMAALADEMVKHIVRLEPQHMSITAWAHARVNFVHEGFLAAVAEAATRTASLFDAQGVGNIVWAFGILGYHSDALVEAMACRAESMVSQLTPQEMANIALGMTCLERPERLRQFLERTVHHFCRVASAADGATWVDFANMVAAAVRAGGAFPGSEEFESRFRELLLDPVQNALVKLAHEQTLAISEALASLQLVLHANSIPYFGELYTRQVLVDLGFERPGQWATEARSCCLAALGNWRIPSTDNIIAYVSWDVRCEAERFGNPGKIFRASWPDEIMDRAKELLQPLRQHVRRDMHPERVALLELFEQVLCSDPGEASLADLQGSVCVYVSQYPCVSCLGVLCQAARRCPGTTFAVDFDNAWTSHCGQPRYSTQ